MFCENCGAELKDGAKFCENCGAPAAPEGAKEPAGGPALPGENPPAAAPKEEKPAPPKEEKPTDTGRKISDSIFYCADGKYRWVYEMSLFKNPTIFILLFKIFFFICLGILAASLIFSAINGDLDKDSFLGSLKVFGIGLGVMTALLVVSYLIYAALMGGKYVVMFEMDEAGINHKQMPKEAKKAKILAGLTLLAGAARGSLTTTGAGIAATRTEMYSEFARVKKVKSYPRRHLIKVNGTLSHNQVYCESADFDFVNDFIRSHCPRA